MVDMGFFIERQVQYHTTSTRLWNAFKAAVYPVSSGDDWPWSLSLGRRTVVNVANLAKDIQV